MKIKIEVNSKEMAALYSNQSGDTQTDIAFDFEADVITESGKLSEKEELLIYGSVLWGLLMGLPHPLIKSYFNSWNEVVIKANQRIDNMIKEELTKAQPNIDSKD